MQQIMDETDRVIKCWWISNIRRNGKCLWIKYDFRWQYLDQFAWNSHEFILGNCPSERVVICTEITPSYIFGNEIWSEKASNQQTLVNFQRSAKRRRIKTFLNVLVFIKKRGRLNHNEKKTQWTDLHTYKGGQNGPVPLHFGEKWGGVAFRAITDISLKELQRYAHIGLR